MFMMIMPVTIAMTGEAINDTTIFPMPPQFRPLAPTEIKTAPINPPTNACDELDGIPNHHVSKFQIIAPISAAMMIFSLMRLAELTISPPIVFATPVETIAPKKFKPAAIIIA